MEGEILRGLARNGVASSTEVARLSVASRTDRGVSARANALALDSPLSPEPLLRALNGIAPEIFFTAAAEIPPSFRVREALRRVYRYFEPPGFHSLPRWREAARLLVGDIDVRSFGRPAALSVPTVRTVDAVNVQLKESGLVVEVVGRSFVWGMIRKIVAALREVDAGRLSLGRLQAATHGAVRLTLPLAEPEPLVLWEVDHGVPWTHFSPGPNRVQARRSADLRDGLWARSQVLSALDEATRRPTASGTDEAAR